MRYVIAMVVALAAALAATLLISSPIATWVVAQLRYDNPDSVADTHALVFMGCNIAALAAGWLVGWMIGGKLEPAEPEI